MSSNNSMLKNNKPPVERVVEKVIEKEIIPEKPAPQIQQEVSNSGTNITMEQITSKWNEIIKEAKREKITLGAFLIAAKPYRIEGNTLYIGFTPESSFCKEQMENKMYHDVFLEVVKRIIAPDIRIKYVTIGKRKATEDDNSDFTKKIVDFFGGEIIE